MSKRTVDLLVIGAGAAGLVAARAAAKLGARVVLAERARPGGDCLWTGCVPSKALLAAAAHAYAARDGARFGVHATPRIDPGEVMAHVRRARERIEPHDSPESLIADGVDVRLGAAVLTAPDSAQVAGAPIRFRRAIVATGTLPARPEIPGLAQADALDSETVWDLEDFPSSLVVLGAGPVGCELAQAFTRLGVAVTLVEAAPRVLPGEEPEASAALHAALVADGVDVRAGAAATGVHGHGDHARVEIGDGTTAAGRVLIALGREPNTSGLGLAEAGVATDKRGYIVVDDRLRTSAARVLAAGDVVGGPAFTHVAELHARVAASNAVLAAVRRVDHRAIPWVTFTDPEVAHVGLTEAAARQRHGDRVRVRVVGHEHVDRALIEDNTVGTTRVVLDGRRRVLGATVVAPRAGEMINELTGLVARGARLRDLAGTVHPYPGWGDAVRGAAAGEVADLLGAPWSRRASRAVVLARRLR